MPPSIDKRHPSNDLDTILSNLRDQLLDAQQRTKDVCAKDANPRRNMSDFERDVLNDIHTLTVEAKQRDHRINDVNDRRIGLHNSVHESIASVELRLESLEYAQPTVFTSDERIDNLVVSMNNVITELRKVRDEAEQKMVELDEAIDERLTEVEESAEDSANRINNAQKYVSSLNKQVEVLEQAVFTHSEEPKEKVRNEPCMTIEPYILRLAKSLSNGNIDDQNSVFEILSHLPADEVSELMNLCRSTASHKPSSAFITR